MDDWEDVLLTAPQPKSAPISHENESSSSSSESPINPILGAVSWLVDNKTGIFSSSSSSLSDDSEESRKSTFRALFRKDSSKDSPKSPGLTRKSTNDSLRDSKRDSKGDGNQDKLERKQSAKSDLRNSSNTQRKQSNSKLEQPPQSVDEQNESDTPENRIRITDCITRDELEILEVLIKKQVDPNVRAANGVPPLVYAVQKQHIPIVLCLLSSSKIDVNGTDVFGQTALLSAAKINPVTPFHKNTSDVIRKLLLDKKGIDPNVQDTVGTTALLYAVTQRDIPFIKLLLAAGADVKLANQQGNTAVHTAALLADEELIYILCNENNIQLINKMKNGEGKLASDLTTNPNIKHYLLGKKTSGSHPLQVGWVDHECFTCKGGKLGVMMCMGKVAKNWIRCLDEDLERVSSEYRPQTIVTLITNTELKEMSVPTIELEIQKRGIESLQCSTHKWLPAATSRFIQVIGTVFKRLQAGNTVLIQCDDGFIRSGLGVAALLVLAGLTQTDATAVAQRIHPDVLTNPAHSVYLFNYAKKIATHPPDLQQETAASEPLTPQRKHRKRRTPTDQKIDVAFTI